jgi:uncharacterized lipoprotein YddW (UPF0748 family)
MNSNKKHSYLKIVAFALCIFVVLQLFGCSSSALNQGGNSSSQQSSASTITNQSTADIIMNSFPTTALYSSSIMSSGNISSANQSSQQSSSSSGNKSSTPAASNKPSAPAASNKPTTPAASNKPSTPVASNKPSTPAPSSAAPTPAVSVSPAAETRGVWVSYVDFAYKATGTVNQKAFIVKIIEDAKNVGLNTIFFQVRPMADSLYKSSVFPWSKYITGTQGKDPGYDPLAYLIEEAHKRNMAVQAWINPYRISAVSTSLSANNPAKVHPDWTVTYTDGNNKQNWLWFNPGLPEVRDLVTQGVAEIVKNYNVDGIHFDDYFYPYATTYYEDGTPSGIKFDDSAAYRQYGNGMSIADWRRNNINLLVKQVHDTIKSINSKTQFGISPFGIWATKSSIMPLGTSTTGMSSYSTLYSDSRLWVINHWVDYICPQIYWGFDTRYSVVLDWWSTLCAQNGVALLVGHNSTIVTSTVANVWSSGGVNQVQYARSKSAYKGSVYFSYSALSSMAPVLKNLYQ